MVDLIAFGSAIVNNLFTNTESKNTKSIDTVIEAINNPDEYLPVIFQDKSVLVHSKSKRYGNGALVNTFIDVTSLEPEQEQRLLQLQSLKKTQQELFGNAITAVIECTLGILQQAPAENIRKQAFILLFDEALWKDSSFINTISNYLGDTDIKSWYEEYSVVFQSPSAEVQSILSKVDTNGSNCKIIREFTDIYYGLDFLDNF